MELKKMKICSRSEKLCGNDPCQLAPKILEQDFGDFAISSSSFV
jgi:hypothetical protein